MGDRERDARVGVGLRAAHALEACERLEAAREELDVVIGAEDPHRTGAAVDEGAVERDEH